jgi:AcrR family transcriptional regulator
MPSIPDSPEAPTPPSDDQAPRRRRRKDARPGEIITAGIAEFADKGFAAARLSDVARRAGIAKGTIYRYFSSKEELFEAALGARLTPVLGDLDNVVDSFPGPTEELMRLAIRRLHQALFEDGLHILMRIIITEGNRFPDVAENYHRNVISRGRAMLGRIVERGVSRGEFSPSAATALPVVLGAPAVMAIVWKMVFERFDPIPADRFADAHADLILKGLLARSG